MIGGAIDDYFTEMALMKAMAMEPCEEQAQWMTAFEELGELIQKISKYNPNRKCTHNDEMMVDSLGEEVADEIADVLILIWKIRIMTGLAEIDVLKKMKEKVKRLEGRLESMGGEK